jgi:hypothetical protein
MLYEAAQAMMRSKKWSWLIVVFEVCSAFTRVAACTLALSPIRDTLIEGFSHFVTSMTAPIASGWSDCRVGLAPTGKRRLFTAHTQKPTFIETLASLYANFISCKKSTDIHKGVQSAW